MGNPKKVTVRAMTLALLVAACGNEAKDDVDRVRSALSQPEGTQLWTGTRTLPVCWMPGQPRASGASWDTQKAWIQAAVTRTWEATADLKFTWEECPMNGTQPFVTVKIMGKVASVPGACCANPSNPMDCCGWDGGSAHYYGTSGLTLPQDALEPNRETVNFIYRDDGMGETDQFRAEAVAIHEFGHILGFRHEQERVQDCNGAPVTVSGTHWTDYDSQSVMNYCAPDRDTLSQLDVIGIRKAYAFHQKDFNRDLGADVLWHHGGLGALGSWSVVNGTVTGTVNIDWSVQSSTGWVAVGTGDFNRDGKPDVLWHHLSNNWVNVWLLDGGHVINNPTVPTPALSSYLGWKIVGTGDFNSDGSTDILWHNPGTGVVVAWLMSGTNVTSTAQVSWQVTGSTGWLAVGTGDFNRDGQTDILWYNGGTGQVSAWLLDGVTVTAGTVLSWTSPASAGWAVVGTGDFNHDGQVDVLWHHGQSGIVGAWIMNPANGTEVLSRMDLSWQAASSSGWRVVSP